MFFQSFFSVTLNFEILIMISSHLYGHRVAFRDDFVFNENYTKVS